MKKFILSLMAITVVMMSLTFNSCKPEDSVVEPQGIAGSIGAGQTENLVAGTDYILDGPLIVEDGGVLNIAAGTVIKANKGFSNYILVLQGGKINVNGTAENPVRMTANAATATSGYWGGLIINGKAPLAGGSTGSTEVNSAYTYGGTVAADNSGTIKYLIIEYPGARSSADVEHNGLTLNGVGSGTVIENIYVLESADDAIEFFGGSVNVKNFLAVNPDDDMFDFTQGYNGTLTTAYGVWAKGYTSTESDPRGIEADGNFDGNFPTQTGQSNFVVNNMTIDLRLDFNTDKTTQMQDAIKIRRGAKATITNAIIKGTGSVADLVDLTDSKGAGDPTSGVSLTSQLTTAPAREVSGVGVVTVGGNNTGADKAVFAWTKYAF